MANLDLFINGSLKRLFRELFYANVSLWNQYKYVAFNIFSHRILIISYEISNENEYLMIKQMN